MMLGYTLPNIILYHLFLNGLFKYKYNNPSIDKATILNILMYRPIRVPYISFINATMLTPKTTMIINKNKDRIYLFLI